MSRNNQSTKNFDFQEDIAPYWVMGVLFLILIGLVAFGLPYHHKQQLEKQENAAKK